MNRHKCLQLCLSITLSIVAVSPFLLRVSSASAATPALRLITEPRAGIAPIDTLFAHAKHSVDLVIYELVDPHIEALLVRDAMRGIKVRVLLDRDFEERRNAAAFAYLSAHHVAVRWASEPHIELTHEKAAVIDGTTALVMTLNLVTADYASTRDFAIVDTERADVKAIDRTFTADWNDVPVTPRGGDLLWSPGAEETLVSLIDGAHHSLLIENEEMADRYIEQPLEQAARRGIAVDVVMTASSEWKPAFGALSRAGVVVRTYAPSASLYIHAKAVVADAGRSDQRAFVGSQNFSITSLVHNRELGIVTRDPAIVNGLATTIRSDFTAGRPWQVLR